MRLGFFVRKEMGYEEEFIVWKYDIFVIFLKKIIYLKLFRVIFLPSIDMGAT